MAYFCSKFIEPQETYTVKDRETGEIAVAKLERRENSHPTLLLEFLLYKRFQETPGIPRLIGYCETSVSKKFGIFIFFSFQYCLFEHKLKHLQ